MSDWVILLVAAVPLFLGWVFALVEVARGSDLRPGRRVVWFVVLIIVPVVSLAVYAVVRTPRPFPSDAESRQDTERAEAIVLAAERHRRGEITDDDYRAVIAR